MRPSSRPAAPDGRQLPGRIATRTLPRAAIATHNAQPTVRSYTGPRGDVAALVPQTSTAILDVGCSDGTLGAHLKARQDCTVTGIELDAGFAARAETRLDRVLAGDAEAHVGRLSAEGALFDAIVCADVLEHLAAPFPVLEQLAGMLDGGGAMVVSLPNARFWTTFYELGVRGTWPRRDRGVHDRTHLQWFTDRDARAMFAHGGLAVAGAVTHYRLSDRPDARVNRLARALARGPLRPFLAYQLLYRLERGSSM